MGKYKKTASGEKLTYRPSNLSRYRGEQFCLRVTLGDMDLDSCFFVYLDERFEDVPIRRLFESYLISPLSEQFAEMESWLDPWKGLDPNLSEKYRLLRQMFAKIQEQSGTITYHINHGPSNFDQGDTVGHHLGTSIFHDNSYDNKILDVVLEFQVNGDVLPEQRQWTLLVEEALAAQLLAGDMEQTPSSELAEGRETLPESQAREDSGNRNEKASQRAGKAARRAAKRATKKAARKAREGAPRTSQPPVDTYRKTAIGERLTYPAPNLARYAGQQFCFRITLGDMHLDSCFFVYLDERFEDVPIRRLFESYLITPASKQIAEMESWLASWKGLDPNLSKKYRLLRQMFAKIQEPSGTITYHINHGPSNFNLGDTVKRHLGTSIFDDNSYNDKILDVVLEFRIAGNVPREQREWKQFGLIHSAPSSQYGEESSWQSTDSDRRDVLNFILGVAAVLVLPFLVFSCMSDEGSSGGSGYVGGGL